MDVYDYNRDKYVDSTDRIIARDNATSRTNALKLITAPSVVTTDDVAATDEHTAVSVAVLSNDRDTKGGALSVFHVNATSSLGASLTINPDKTIRYDPSASATLQALLTGQSLWDTFTYTIKDSKGLLDTATVKVLVSGLDEPSGVKGVQIAASGIGSVVSALPSATANAKAHTFGRAAACDTVFKSWSFDNSFGCLSWLDDFDLLGYLSQKSKKGSSSFDHAVDTVRAHSASRRNWAV
jgi:VCBS repeat-containing protein